MPAVLIMSRLSLNIVGLTVLLLLQGCTSLPQHAAERRTSAAFAQPELTSLGRMALRSSAPHGGNSGFSIQDTGRQAFLQRAALIEAAERSIDAQYYIWNSDVSGRYLAKRLLLAADRGVRVRLLLDDFNSRGRDHLFAALDNHPNIAVRLYNPLGTREGPGKAMEALREFRRVNRRMHNKTFVVDAAFGIVGGRNIGDEYFGLHSSTNFLDRDMLAVGPVVGDISDSFDRYWNSHAAYPAADLAGKAAQTDPLGRRLAAARASADDTEGLACAPPRRADVALAAMGQWLEAVEWAPAELVFSEPIPQVLPAEDHPAPTATRLAELTEASRREVLIESAYFILGDRQLTAIDRLTRQGIGVRAITNSLASNDLLGNHAGYARSRRGMLGSGIRLHELRPDAQICAGCALGTDACEGDVALHSKSVVFDRRVLYVGSFNINLRSIYLNGETVLIVHSPRLAASVAESIETAMQSDNSWQLAMEDNGPLRWHASDGVYRREPATGWWRRAKASLIGLLPIEKYY
jgi:putative cardiolipin synthase